MASLQEAAGHYGAGRLDLAEAACRAALAKSPGEPNALHLMGLLALHRGDHDRAIKIIEQALPRLHDPADALNNLGNAYRAAGRSADALAAYRKAIAARPAFASAHSNLGLVLCETGDQDAATASARKAAELDPGDPGIWTNLGNVHRAGGDLAAAETALRRAVALNPRDADGLANLANVQLDLRRLPDAIRSYRRALELAPTLARANHGLGVALALTGDAIAATASFRAALTLAPGNAAIWNDLGRALRATGKFDDAAQAFRKALELDPAFADAYRNLASCNLLAPEEKELVQARSLMDRPGASAEDRSIAGFALGKLLDDADRFDEAFAAYAEANALYRDLRAAAGDRFDGHALRRRVDELIASFPAGFFEATARWGVPDELPVFILGMPRSGTSLVEQIAASHGSVHGAGELRSIGARAAQLGDAPQTWNPDTVRRAAEAHLAELRALGGGASRVTDKLPDNVFMLGVIATLFPGARVIFCERDPRDIGLSCFFQKFSVGQLTFSYDLADCGTRCRETARLMDHWRRVLPLRTLDVGYEALVADLEGQSRRIIDFLGLDWEPRCLDFHRTERTVNTASGWQVRQPLYGRSVARWRHYERHLGPFMQTLTGSGA